MHRAAAILLLLVATPLALGAPVRLDGFQQGALGELFTFTAAADGVIDLRLDPGREVGTGSIVLFDAQGRMLVHSEGIAEDGDIEIMTTWAQHTVLNSSGGAGNITLRVGQFCAEGCPVIIYGAGAVDRIDYTFRGEDATLVREAGGFRTFLSHGYVPADGVSAVVRARALFMAGVQRDAHESIHIQGSPVISAGISLSCCTHSHSFGNMTIVRPDGAVQPCFCSIGDLSVDAPGEYHMFWNRTERGDFVDILYSGVDVVR